MGNTCNSAGQAFSWDRPVVLGVGLNLVRAFRMVIMEADYLNRVKDQEKVAPHFQHSAILSNLQAGLPATEKYHEKIEKSI